MMIVVSIVATISAVEIPIYKSKVNQSNVSKMTKGVTSRFLNDL